MRAFTKLRLARVTALAVALGLGAEACRCDEDSFRTSTTTTSDLPNQRWNDGVDCSAPKPDVVQLADDTFIFRQPLCVNFEGPFLYLFFGRTRALLLDSGTRASNMATPVLATFDAYKARHGLTTYPLVVAHTHSHGDHIGGDGYFAGRSDVTVVRPDRHEVAAFFGLEQQTTATGEVRRWPDTAAGFDLGDRVLDIVPLPGHDAAHILVYDAKERLLLTGDTLYPGRLYIDDWDQFRASARRLSDFASSHDVRWVLGAHIELRNEWNPDGTAVDYAMGEAVHADEHTLVLAADEPMKLWLLVQAQGATPRREASEHFILSP